MSIEIASKKWPWRNDADRNVIVSVYDDGGVGVRYESRVQSPELAAQIGEWMDDQEAGGDLSHEQLRWAAEVYESYVPPAGYVKFDIRPHCGGYSVFWPDGSLQGWYASERKARAVRVKEKA